MHSVIHGERKKEQRVSCVKEEHCNRGKVYEQGVHDLIACIDAMYFRLGYPNLELTNNKPSMLVRSSGALDTNILIMDLII